MVYVGRMVKLRLFSTGLSGFHCLLYVCLALYNILFSHANPLGAQWFCSHGVGFGETMSKSIAFGMCVLLVYRCSSFASRMLLTCRYESYVGCHQLDLVVYSMFAVAMPRPVLSLVTQLGADKSYCIFLGFFSARVLLTESIQWMGTILFRILYIFPMWFCSAASWAFPLISPQSCFPTSEKFAESVSGFDHIRWRFLRLFLLALTDSPIVWTLLIGFLSLSSMGSLATFPLCHKCRLQIRRSFLLLWSNFFDVSYNLSIFLVASLYSASVAGSGKMCWFSFSKVCS